MTWTQPDACWSDESSPSYGLRASGASVSMLQKTGDLYTCTVCKAAFVKQTALEKHMAKHTGEKRWICSVCYTAFARKDYLTSHMMVHTGEKPYKCHVCPAAYRQKGKLNKHMTSVHPEEKFIVSPMKALNETPHTLSGTPHKLSGTPHKLSETPHNLSETPHK